MLLMEPQSPRVEASYHLFICGIRSDRREAQAIGLRCYRLAKRSSCLRVLDWRIEMR